MLGLERSLSENLIQPEIVTFERVIKVTIYHEKIPFLIRKLPFQIINFKILVLNIVLKHD